MKLPARFLEPIEIKRHRSIETPRGFGAVTDIPFGLPMPNGELGTGGCHCPAPVMPNPTYSCIYPGGAVEVVTRRGELEEVAPPAIRRDLSPALLAAIHSAPYGEFHLTNTKAS